ncbi:MAG: hypothetical protein IH840_07790 [Candidatus Heimdallarchaeota archaeon]|nr:hypothetical protein [Candidatus Heimdallarchaeota archaeon]
MESLLHPQFGFPPEVKMKEYGLVQKVVKSDKVKSPKGGMNWIKFIKLLNFDEDVTVGPGPHPDQYNGKTDFMNERKWLSKILHSWKIVNIIAEKDMVWVSRDATVNDPMKLNLTLNAILYFWFKENKIIAYTGAGRFLNTILQYGNIILDEDLKSEVDHYLLELHRMGMIPAVSKY